MTADPPAEPFRMLVVCTGNICRSPFAEQMLRAAFARVALATANAGWVDAVEVTSAGTVAMIGRPVEPQMSELLQAHGANPFEHAARQLEPELIAGADLVLGLAREHRRDIVTVLPAASRRVFALNEFARLLEDAVGSGSVAVQPCGSAASAMAAIADAAAMRRGFALAPDDPAIDDVADPYGYGPEAYASAAVSIAGIVDRIERGVLVGIGARR